MTETGNQFRVVLRGYDPAQVDRRMSELGEAAGETHVQVEQLTGRVRQLEQERDRALERAAANTGSVEPVEEKPADFNHLGERVGQILTLAEEEADEIRTRAAAELDAERQAIAENGARVRSEADRYATERRSEADTEAARILEDARRTADERLDAADRDAAARLQEAEAVYEDQRARAAKAATDFETTLAARRTAAEQEFKQRMGDTEKRLEEAEKFLESARSEAETTTDEALREARRIVSESEQQAAQIVNDAKSTAARVRSDSERELAAATQRRDSINAQLANVRQMLATLTGVSPSNVLDAFEGGSAAQDGAVEGADEAEAGGPVPAQQAPSDETAIEGAGLDADAGNSSPGSAEAAGSDEESKLQPAK
jgi:cell division septum initiation protein DivIVA